MYSAQEMKNKFNMMANLMGDEGDDDDDQDSIKEAFLETNPYLLGLTFVVSIVHSVFEFLAFKNGKQRILIVISISFTTKQLLLILSPSYLQIFNFGTTESHSRVCRSGLCSLTCFNQSLCFSTYWTMKRTP